jgi:H+/Cl- antiporter ClcA
MVSFLTGVTRSPFTCAILVLEMTDRNNLVFHLMLAGMIASLAAIMVDKHSLYDHLKDEYIHQLIREDAEEQNKLQPLVINENDKPQF